MRHGYRSERAPRQSVTANAPMPQKMLEASRSADAQIQLGGTPLFVELVEGNKLGFFLFFVLVDIVVR